MNDTEILHHIDAMVKEEHTLLQKREEGQISDDQHARIQKLEIELDQCWDLLRQRRARREFGLNPDEAQERGENIVEHYQQ
ncbi:MAG TPA: DUF2630 family protein [Ktedonobacteraceae bacterium]|jgi:hypothetical protein|nr:DUF2630 family protein [Ktedonobacteraceae bacterium]